MKLLLVVAAVFGLLFLQDSAQASIHNLSSQIKPPGEKVFVFSPRLKRWAVYAPNGSRIAWAPANGGSNWCADLGRSCRSPVGHFRIQSKGSAGCKSSRYPRPNGGAPMPYCMFFNGNYAIHGSPQISNRNGSHGCVRVTTTAARWLHANFLGHGTKVIVLPY